jgi:hypothetical protein
MPIIKTRFQMSRVTPQMRNFAKRLIANETLKNKSFETKSAEAFHVIERLRPHMVTLIGNGGFRALFSRALALSNAEVPWLRAMHVKSDGGMEGLEALREKLHPNEFLEGCVVLLAQLLGLLVAFIGPNLTLLLVGDIWPQISLNDLDFGNGGKNEKPK